MAFRKSICRGCGAEIIWIRTTAGKSMPCDPEPVSYWASTTGKQVIITPNGEARTCRLEGPHNDATGIGYISHFATCPKANQFKKR